MTFTSGGTTLCPVDVATATSCATLATLAPGAYPVTGTYSGDPHFAGSSDTTAFSVPRPRPTSPARRRRSTPYATPITLTVGGLPSGATGMVTLTSGTLTLCTVTLPATALRGLDRPAAGSYPATVNYPGDADYPARPTTFSFAVTKAPTALTASATPAVGHLPATR